MTADSRVLLARVLTQILPHDQQNLARMLAESIPFSREIYQFAFHPNTVAKLLWDTFVLLLVFYSAFYTPYQTAYYLPKVELSAVDYFVDLCFWADMLLTFWTGYDKGFEVIMDKGQIISHYLKGWFIIDLMATVNWSAVMSLVAGSAAGVSPVVGMLRLLKVLRLTRSGRIIKRLTMTWTVHTKFIDAFNFFLYVLVVCHLLACLFYMIPMYVFCPIDHKGAWPYNRPCAQ